MPAPIKPLTRVQRLTRAAAAAREIDAIRAVLDAPWAHVAITIDLPGEKDPGLRLHSSPSSDGASVGALVHTGMNGPLRAAFRATICALEAQISEDTLPADRAVELTR